jgi:hypothetical protein
MPQPLDTFGHVSRITRSIVTAAIAAPPVVIMRRL